MPGYRRRVERAAQIIVRVTVDEKAAWGEYAKQAGCYVSELVRTAVKAWIKNSPNPRKQGRHSYLQ